MIHLSLSEVYELHNKLIHATGGSPGVRDNGLLESAVIGCYQSFGGVDLYPTIIDKSARMAYAICKNHPFIDGNKRVAVTAMLVKLRLNGINLTFTQPELVALGLGIADGSLEYEDIISWINEHLHQ